MNNEKAGRIRPAEFQSPDQGNGGPGHLAVSAQRRPLRPLLLIATLILLAAATVFYLPTRISPLDSQTNVAAEGDSIAFSEIEEQPFSDVQLLRARREAQEILAELIGVQNELEDLQVEAWAGEVYAALLQEAQSGDQAYQERDFGQALVNYQGALATAKNLMDARATYAEQLLEQADQAFTVGDSQAAANAYALVQVLQPGLEAARIGAGRSAVLDQVTELKISASELQVKQEWEAARAALNQAAALDPLDEEVQSDLVAVENQITQQNFRARLAEGFNALARSDYVAARTAFSAANALIPNHPTVTDAMLQVDSAAETQRRSSLLDQAIVAESEESWELAVARYRELLDRDPANVEARVGVVRAEARAQLDRRIVSVLADPLALQSDEAWNNAERLLSEARAVREKTPKLIRQINELEQVIQRARTPVELTLLSDGMTQIEIYRLGRLGTLTEHRVSIYPGEYVVIGRRSGFRDVRETLQVSGTSDRISLRIEATEPINR